MCSYSIPLWKGCSSNFHTHGLCKHYPSNSSQAAIHYQLFRFLILQTLRSTLSSNYSSVRSEAKKAGDATVVDIRALVYKKGEVFFKLRHADDWTELQQRKPKKPGQLVKSLYNEALKIDKSKLDSLQSLKEFMHKDNHHFYDHLK